MSTEDRLEINWINSAGGALGAVSSAVVLSTFGAAGTLVGAAVGSLCITVGGSVYSHSMRKTKNRMAAVASHTGARKTRSHESRSHESETGIPTGEPVPPPGADASKQDPEKNGLPWKRIAVMTGALFAIAIAVILAFELFAGRPVSSFTGGTSDTDGGTTFSRVVDSPGGGDTTKDEEEKPDDQAPAENDQQNDAPAEEQPDEAPAPEPQQNEAPAPEPQP